MKDMAQRRLQKTLADEQKDILKQALWDMNLSPGKYFEKILGESEFNKNFTCNG